MPITLLDIPPARGSPVSPHTWKVRLALNFKQLDYDTKWVAVVDIEETCRKLKIPPSGVHPDGKPHYTLPAIIDSTRNAVLSDSLPILRYLDTTYPSSPSLFTPAASKYYDQTLKIFFDRFTDNGSLLMMWGVYQSTVPRDRVAFREKTEKKLGQTLEEANPKGEDREKRWKNVEELFKGLKKSKPYLLGTNPTFCDFLLVGWLTSIRNVSPEAWNERIAKWDGGKWASYWGHFEEWAENPRSMNI
ncbi:hypothetical protein C8J56DRAFT_884171 [Mycena floridula]|nr:hypothetical protein C8J56DRAFT_884171 [Mycena floridula]